jgi:hypothetical protein
MIVCKKTSQLTTAADIANALQIDPVLFGKRLKKVQALIEQLGVDGKYKASALPATKYVESVISKLIGLAHSSARLRVTGLTKKMVALAEESCMDSGRKRQPLVVAAAVLALEAYVRSELPEDTPNRSRKELSLTKPKVAAMFEMSQNLLKERTNEMKDMLLEIASVAGLENCTEKTVVDSLLHLVDHAEDYKGMVVITPAVEGGQSLADARCSILVRMLHSRSAIGIHDVATVDPRPHVCDRNACLSGVRSLTFCRCISCRNTEGTDCWCRAAF